MLSWIRLDVHSLAGAGHEISGPFQRRPGVAVALAHPTAVTAGNESRSLDECARLRDLSASADDRMVRSTTDAHVHVIDVPVRPGRELAPIALDQQENFL